MESQTYSISRLLYILESFQKKAVWFLSIFTLICAVLYGFFVVSTILNVVEREKILSELALVGGDISSLESRYEETANLITIDFAKTLGFYEVRNVKYITQTGLALSSN